MRIETEKIDDILKVQPLEKRIDASVSTAFKGRLTTWIKEGNRRIVLDLSSVEFLDSSGLGAIVSSLKTALRGEGDLVISGIWGPVESLFRLTRLNRVFHIFKTDAEAVDFLRKSR